jgi:hypothetical protein
MNQLMMLQSIEFVAHPNKRGMELTRFRIYGISRSWYQALFMVRYFQSWHISLSQSNLPHCETLFLTLSFLYPCF